MIRSTFFAAIVSTALAFQNGDTCGVTSRDFMSYDYRSDYMVAGTDGCTLGDENGCFCAPNLDDKQSLGEWQWQCNNVVNFGPNPSTTKVCPITVPVAKGLGDLSFVMNRKLADSSQQTVGIGAESPQQKLSVPCNTDIHPTGHTGDEVCPYSDCDEGGEHSAICACIDLAKYGMGDGTEWVCMHATCNCEEMSVDETGMNDLDKQEDAPAAEDLEGNVSAGTHLSDRWFLQSGIVTSVLYLIAT